MDILRPESGIAPADPVEQRLDEQALWYSRKSAQARTMYKRVKLAQIVVGALVPVLAALSAPAYVTAVTAALVVMAEGAQQLFQWQPTWIQYRFTAELLKHERYLYLAQVGPYTAQNRREVLAQRVETITFNENAAWAERNRSEQLSDPSAGHNS
ncbi:DUF4231 domain-containing protein [Nocardia yunnanensis]|uniref:DUF4231 domain-containing protein n=1 Tax=Nocardia yunnanensis TaxID=2382165 RepID=A0A386ZLC0_9NOCA|nr:DUF4231 domain-containing protein [Nocardia yunnanensis]AYF78371.1 DUF4231 domain-containing protein [Nocardia yunnanensis]